MARRYIKYFILFGLMMPSVSVSHAAELTSQEDSIALIEGLSQDTIKILTSDVSQLDKESQIRALLTENLDIERIGLLIAGKAIRKATAAQKTQYKPAIRNYIEIKYSKLIGGYNGQSIEILNTARAGKSDALVNTQIIQEGSEPVTVSWRVSNKRKRLMVLDVIVEGISMLLTERQQFESVLQSKKFDGLIDTLEKKVTDMVAES